MKITLTIVLFAVFSLSSSAQEPFGLTKGLNAYQSYSSGIDSVSYATGTVVLNIPLLSFPQKGALPPVTLRLTYNAGDWFSMNEFENDPGAQPITVWFFRGNGVIASLSPVQTLNFLTDPTGDNVPEYQVSDITGATHIMGYATDPNNYMSPPTELVATDTSGYTVLLQPQTGNWIRQVIRSPNGVSQSRIFVPDLSCPSDCAYQGDATISDLSGNQMTVHYDSTGSLLAGITDSLGRQIPNLQPSFQMREGQLVGFNGGNPAGCIQNDYPGYKGGVYSITACMGGLFASKPAIPGTNDFGGNSPMFGLTSLTLPGGKSWQFGYDSYGDLQDIYLPTGGHIHYEYEENQYTNCIGPDNYHHSVRTRDYDAGNGQHLIWTYTWHASPTGNFYTGIVTVQNPDGTSEIHDSSGSYDMCYAYETKTSYINKDGTEAETINRTYSRTGLNAFAEVDGDMDIPTGLTPETVVSSRNGVVVSSACSIYDGNSNTDCRGLDSYNSLGRVFYGSYWTQGIYPSNYPAQPFPWVVGSKKASFERDGTTANTDLRVQRFSYLYEGEGGAAYDGAGIYSPVSSISTSSPQGVFTTSRVAYDEEAYSTGCVCALPTSQLPSEAMPEWQSHKSYNLNGMIASSIDANGNITSYQYDSSGAFLSKVTSAVAAAGFQQFSHDFNTGLLTSKIDQNENLTTYDYDILGRLTTVTYPQDGGVESTSYDESGNYPKVKSSSTSRQGAGVSVATQLDGIGRPIHTVTSDPLGDESIDRTYSDLSRLSSESNAYRATPLTTDPPSGMTFWQYDSLGRVVSTQNPDGSVAQNVYQGLTETSCDETRRCRLFGHDLLGRLATVDEGATVNAQGITCVRCLRTMYSYDVANNLTSVEELGATGDVPRIRSMIYDPLSRLTCTANPEVTTGPCPDLGSHYFYTTDLSNSAARCSGDSSQPCTQYTQGTIQGAYTQKVFHYDAMNRVTQITGNISGTKCFQYDQAVAGKGYLSAEWTQSSDDCTLGNMQHASTSRIVLAYDTMGRIISETQCVLSSCTADAAAPFQFHYSYEYSGSLTAMDDGIGQFSWSVQHDALDRILSVTATSTVQSVLYPSQILNTSAYTPEGRLSTWTLGGLTPWALQGTKAYDNRGRPTAEKVIGHD